MTLDEIEEANTLVVALAHLRDTCSSMLRVQANGSLAGQRESRDYIQQMVDTLTWALGLELREMADDAAHSL